MDSRPHFSAIARPPRRGFTLIELLVVITIIGILMSLMLPAVQTARESARRVSCTNNTKQLSLAVINYEVSFQQLPPSGQYAPAPANTAGYVTVDFRSGKMFSWIVAILPQIEQQALADSIDMRRSIVDQSGNPQAVAPDVLLCPSEEAAGRFYEYEGRQFAKGNYAAWVSPLHTDYQNHYPGALISHRVQTMAAIRDGASNTLLIGEVRTRDHNRDERGVWALGWNGATQLAYDAHPSRFSIASGRRPPQYSYLGVISRNFVHTPNSQGINVDMLFDCPDSSGSQLDRMPCARFGSVGANRYWSSAPRSNHHGGVMVAYLDGSVGFLPDSIDQTLMAHLVSVDDGQVTERP